MAKPDRNRSRKGSGRSSERSFADRTSQAISDRPIASAAIVSGVAAAIAGFLAFRKSGKTFGEFTNDLTTGASTRIKDGVADMKSRSGWSEPTKDGVSDGRTQSEIAEEAMTRKQIGKKTKRPVDPTIEEELKTGAVSY
jgi:hypothetical protein